MLETCELTFLGKEVDEYLDFGTQEFRRNRHRHVIDRAARVCPQIVNSCVLFGRDEHDWYTRETRVFSHHPREVVAAPARHVHVGNYEGHVGPQQYRQRFFNRVSLEQALSQFGERRIIRKQLRWRIIDQQNIEGRPTRSFGLAGLRHLYVPQRKLRCSYQLHQSS